MTFLSFKVFFFPIPEDFQVWSEENELFILEQLSQNCLFKFWSKKRNLSVFYLLLTATTALWYEQSEESQVFTPCFEEMEACYWPMASGPGSIVVQIKNLWSKRSSLPPFLPSQIRIGHWDRRTSLPLQPVTTLFWTLPLLLQLLLLWTFYLQSCPTRSYFNPHCPP